MATPDSSPRAHVAPLLAASALCVVSALAPSASAMAQCTLEPSVLFAYPSLETETTLPRNAELLFVTAGTISRSELVWSDLYRSHPRNGGAFDRYRMDVEDRLTLGRHEAELVVDAESGSVLVGPDTFPLSFTVDDVDAPPPDASGSVTITRVFTYGRWVGGIVRDDPEARGAASDDPADCSAEVGIQAGCGGGRGWGPLVGLNRIELEAEGNVLGFALNERYFLPAHCRSAFVWESGPYSIRVVTETGLGSPSEYAGEIGLEVSDAPDPLDYSDPNPACSMAPRGGVPSRSGPLAVALLLGLVTARRRSARTP